VFDYTLVVNGYSDRFSLCQRTGGNDYALLYNAAGEDITIGDYKFGNCNQVGVYVAPVGNS
jgi:hypothetical protein